MESASTSDDEVRGTAASRTSLAELAVLFLRLGAKLLLAAVRRAEGHVRCAARCKKRFQRLAYRHGLLA